MTSIPWLTILWAIPMAGAAIVMLLPASQRTVAKWLALLISLAVLAVSLVVAVGFKPGGEQYQFVENHFGKIAMAGAAFIEKHSVADFHDIRLVDGGDVLAPLTREFESGARDPRTRPPRHAPQ